jgi:hypothetical protein
MNIKLTVYFDAPFWVGVFERTDEGALQTSRVVFGSEPKDYEVYSYVLENYFKLRFSPPLKVEVNKEKNINPKRLKRMIRREVARSEIGTKAQQAIKLEYEARKQENKKLSREKQEEQEEQKFKMRQEKKKEKRKGR